MNLPPVVSRVFWFLYFWLFLLVCSASPIKADQDFQTSYYFTYSIDNEALTRVKQEINIKNLTEKIYVNEYSMSIGSTQISNVRVWDDYGPIEPEIKPGENYTTIIILFKERVVGKDKTNHLNIEYYTPDFAAIKGQVLEVNIPALAQKDQLFDYQVSLLIPEGFGPPSYIRPDPGSKNSQGSSWIFSFSKKQLSKAEGITAAFGDAQIFDFKFIFFLENNNNFPGRTEIALPADTPFQRVYYQQINPKPLEIKTDGDDNWLASYKLNASQKLTVTATGSAQLYILPKPELENNPPSNENLKKYLTAQKYWEIDDPGIIRLAEELKTPQKIYKYVVDNMIYDYGRLDEKITRLGASQALGNKQSALCTEFADLFIAICRAAGIPAREVDGYAFTANPKLRPLSLSKDILHAWAEYYDFEKQLWIGVDPTWEMTTGGVDYFEKLDLNHFAFARHGLDSEYPPPAGSYNNSPDIKTIFIEFGLKKDFKPQITFQESLPSYVMGGFPIKGKIVLVNPGPAAWHRTDFYIRSSDYTQTQEIEVLPPMSEKTIPFSIKTNWLAKKEFDIKVQFGEYSETYNVVSLPFYSYIFKKLAFWQ